MNFHVYVRSIGVGEKLIQFAAQITRSMDCW